MARRGGEVLVGTSGWSYRHWEGRYYPKDLPREEHLAFYARDFAAVEINRTFYKLPEEAELERWRERAPEGFVFAVKASRYLTHMRKLKETGEGLHRFFEPLDVLGDKLGPVLFQLPPRWRANAERLDAFLDALPPGPRYVFEFRDPSWFVEEVYDLLREHDVAFCAYGIPGWSSPRPVTSDLAYARFHGRESFFEGPGGEAALDEWARQVEEWRDAGLDVHAYFNNDHNAYAIADGRALLGALAERGVTAPAGLRYA